MPTYSYKCKKCDEFNYTHAMHHQIFFCPYCGERVKKTFKIGGVSFKGSGFYSTDNKGK